MSRKIIGVTVGTQLPKPNFDQTDPTKGDYIRGDRSFLTTDTTFTKSGKSADAKAVGDALATKQPIGDYALKSELEVLPTVTTNDAGKFLRVSANGVWVAEAIPSAEGATF